MNMELRQESKNERTAQLVDQMNNFCHRIRLGIER